MGSRYEKEESRKKILSACVRLFWVQGFRKTPPKQILQEAGVSAGTFYNLYKSKAGVLMELTDFMFSQQFGIAGKLSAGGASPALVYALETSIQLALTELNENLREIYIEVYTQPDILERIRQKTTAELQRIFGPYCRSAAPAISTRWTSARPPSCAAIWSTPATCISRWSGRSNASFA